ncbi:MAG: DUF1926 domain-containing protein [Candidatus Omnitrophica bacterium]|nr:DUF1926 domain-containing protein [Candidatus Omnitrophota bacterium]
MNSVNMEKMKLLIAIHSHQPVGNFDHVFETAFNKAYLPFLDVLEKHPQIKIALHYSGSLLDWLEHKKPEFIQRIKRLTEKKQIEILSAGYYEPILVLLNEEDRIGQIKLLNEKIFHLWSVKPQGAWLTERVWEPDLPKTFKEADIAYTIVDDTHFEKTGKMREELWGYYLTEYDNKITKIFPGSKFLRYALPFKLPDETIGYLKQSFNIGRKAITFADDGEKFGLWPGTYKWVYEEHWLERFFQIIENNGEWLETVTFSEYLAKFPPTGRIYLPCASYDEMLDWSNGYFRNFLAKYPEANHMHKRMLEVSRKVQNAKCKMQSLEFEEARRYLYMSQNNDSYWHGVFGGLYLNHLRCSAYSNLIRAENIVEKSCYNKNDWLDYKTDDFDCDGANELMLSNKLLKIYIDLEEKAGIYEIDHKDKEINIVNTIARRKEKYHDKIREKILANTECSTHRENTASIHDIEKHIPREWEEFLVYDRYRKGCLLEHFLNADVTKENFLKNNYEEKESLLNRYILDSVDQKSSLIRVNLKREFFCDGLPFEIQKTLILESNMKRISYAYSILNKSKTFWNGKFAVEFNFSLWDNLLSSLGERDNINNLLIKDTWFGIEIEMNFNKQGKLWHFPVETIYETESGFEKTYQELGIVLVWELNSIPEKEFRISGDFELK